MTRVLSHELADTLRRRALPWLIWLGLVGGGFFAWRAMGLGMSVRGFAEATPYRLTAVESARVESVLVKVGDRVSAGQVVAVLDARAIDGELKAAQANKAAALAEMAKAEVEARQSWLESNRDVDQATLTTVRLAREAKTRLETARAELVAVKSELTRRRQSVASGAMRASDLTELEIRQAALARTVTEETASVTLYEQKELPPTLLAADSMESWVATAKAPLERMVEVYDGQARALEARRDQQILRAPVDGQVVAVHGLADSVAVPDLPLIEIVTDAPGRIVACVNEELNIPVAVGVTATARPRSSRSVVLHGTATSVTPIVELPVRCWRSTQIPVWGRLVTVELSPRVTLVPGETFDITFTPGDGT